VEGVRRKVEAEPGAGQISGEVPTTVAARKASAGSPCLADELRQRTGSPAGRWRSGGVLLSQQRLGDCGTSAAGGVFRLAGLHDP
jgi:hypothetical protein